MKIKRSAVTATALAVLVAMLPACASVVEGQAFSPLYDPFRAGGLPVIDGPSGVRDNAPQPFGSVRYTDGGDIDKLALLAANDIGEFWQQHYNQTFDGAFLPIDNFASWDSDEPSTPEMCGMELYRQPNAFFCYPERLMAWDRGVFVPTGERFFGPMSVVALIAHEYGHAVQKMAGLTNRRTPTIVAEQQADCLTEVYLRWVAEGNSPRFTLSTDAGLNHVLAGAIAIRDPIWTEDYTEMLDHGHGTAVDRIAAFQMGFVTGATACAAIDIDDVDKRRGELPMILDDENGRRQTGEAPISEGTLNTLVEALGKVFNPQEAPTLSLNPPACRDAQATPPAFYCPATNTIGVNLPVLKKMGIAANEADDEVLIQGDNTALSIVTSRYAQAVQY
jgi:predicted metalloprotease